MSKRNLYLTNTPVEEALDRFSAGIDLEVKTEEVEVIHALDRVTAKAVYALCNSPLYNCAAMDGIAVYSAATKGADESSPLTLKDFVVVDTGDPIKPPYDAVIMAEDLQDEATIRKAAAPWQHVRPVGEDIVQSEMILPTGHKIRPLDIGVLLSGGIARITVRKRPTVAIIPTGSEMIELISDLQPGNAMESGHIIGSGGIIESNSRMLEGMVRQLGGEPIRLTPVPDEYEKLKSALTGDFDMILVIAGTSAGREDYTVHILRELGQVLVHGVAMKPGKPVILASLAGKPVVGIPGYPVSAYLAFENFAAPVLRVMSGFMKSASPTIKASLARKLVSSLKHREYVRVKVGQVGTRFVASPLARGAGAAMSLVRADGFCVIGQNLEGIEAGSEVDILLSRGLEGIDRTVVSIGSHDLIMDILADLVPLSSTHVGSMAGLLALKNGETHIAPLHLLDEAGGEYNVPILKKLFADREMALIKGVGRIQGIMVAKGNPLNIRGLEDLTRCSFVNRQRGAGTRLLLDHKLKALGISPTDINGYDNEVSTHMAVAVAVKEGNCDAGLGVLSAANAMNLDFIPIGEEEYDFAIPKEFLELPHIHVFIDALKSPEFLARLKALGGYTTDHCGEIVYLGKGE